jgi:hypothetical protein
VLAIDEFTYMRGSSAGPSVVADAAPLKLITKVAAMLVKIAMGRISALEIADVVTICSL